MNKIQKILVPLDFSEGSVNALFIHTAMGDPGEVRIRRKVEMGNPDSKIIRVAKEERADLIVLAIKRRSFFSYLMAGSILLKLTWRSPCPVLFTRRHLEEFSGQSGSLIWGRLWKAVPITHHYRILAFHPHVASDHLFITLCVKGARQWEWIAERMKRQPTSEG